MTKLFKMEGSEFPQPLGILAACVEECVGGSVMVAGGVLRDIIHGVQPKDIDLWVYVEEEKRNEAMAALIEVLGEPKMEMSTASTLGNERNVSYIVEFDTPLPLQIIFLSRDMSLAELLEDFDFGLCQVGSDDGFIYCTEAFKDDYENKTLTYMRHGETTSRILGRLQRMVAKFPKHTPTNVPQEVLDAVAGISLEASV